MAKKEKQTIFETVQKTISTISIFYGFFFFCVFFIYRYIGGLPGNSMLFLMEESLIKYFLCILIPLGLAGLTMLGDRVRFKAVLFANCFFVVVLFVQVFISVQIFLLKDFFFLMIHPFILNTFSFLLNISLFFVWPYSLIQIFYRYFQDSVEKVMAYLVLGFCLLYFWLVWPMSGIPSGGSYAYAMIEKYPAESEALVKERKKGSNRDLFLTYSFQAAKGIQECRQEGSIFDDAAESAKEGTTVVIKYSKKYPRFCKAVRQ